MTVGMPGSGIGGLFYFCLVLWMPFNEAYQTLRGRSSLARWKSVGVHWSILAGILIALWAEAWLLDLGVRWARAHDTADTLAPILGDAQSTRGMFLDVGQFAAIGSLITLGVILAFTASLRGAMRTGLLKQRRNIPAKLAATAA